MNDISNWGNYPRIKAVLHEFSTLEELKLLLREKDSLIARGNGRCYGDSSLAENMVSTRRFNRILSLDSEKGRISCESGVLFSDLLKATIPRGWFPPVTPGTKYVTVGGAIASDVHGKNHHQEGSFSGFLDEIVLLTSDLNVLRCSRAENPLVFEMTCGGMGLTGIILEATFRLKPIESAFIRQETVRATDLDHAMSLFESRSEWTYSVCWMDGMSSGAGLGRGRFVCGEHATREEVLAGGHRIAAELLAVPERKMLLVPFNLPKGVLNSAGVRMFNRIYYHRSPRTAKQSLVSYEPFFYPLDGVRNWNRIYGRNGFLQYQFVLPAGESRGGLIAILERIQQSRILPFLAVLKLFGEPAGGITFPMKGYTLALDFPARKNVFRLLDELDALVLEFGGRIYLTKDARMRSDTFSRSYAGAARFCEVIRKTEQRVRFESIQSKRIGLTQ